MDDAARGGPAVSASGDPASVADDRELVRLNEAGVITGVCAGLGSYTRIDPIVWRASFALTALAGGTGLALYLAAWMMMRDTGGGPAMAEQLLNRRIAPRAVPTLLGAGLAAAAAFSLVGGFSWGTLVLATPLILGALVAHNRGVGLQRTFRELPGLLQSKEPPPAAPPPEPKPAYFNPAQPWAQAPVGPIDLKVVADRASAAYAGGDGPGGDESRDGDEHGDADGPGETDDGAGSGGGGPVGGGGPASGAYAAPGRAHWAHPDRAYEHAFRAREWRREARERRREARRRRGFRWFRLVFWGIVATTGIALGLNESASAADLLGPSLGPVYLGSVVVIIGVALVASTWVGDPRGLIGTGVLVTLVLIAAVSLDVSSLRFGMEQWRPATVAEAERPRALTGGFAELDLTSLELAPGQRVEIAADVRFGALHVLVPDSARVIVHGRASFGEIRVDDVVRAGTRLDVRRTLEPEAVPGPGTPDVPDVPDAPDAPGTEPAPADGTTDPAGDGRETAEDSEGDESTEPPTLVVDLRAIGADMEVRRVAS